MRWHLVQHGFATLHTHYYQEARCWQQALAGLDWIGYANSALPPVLAKELELLPCFPLLPDGHLDPDPVSRELTDYLAFSSVFAAHCAQHLTPRLSGDDLVLVSYCTQRELFGAALWLQGLAPERRPRMAFVFHLPDLSWQIAPDRSQISGNISAWRHAANQLDAVLPPSRRVIGATSARLADCLGNVFGLPVQLLPLVLTPVAPGPPARPATSYDIMLAGEFRWEKGSTLCEPLLLQLARWRPELRFSVQVREPAEALELRQRLRQQDFAGRLDIVFGALDMADYAARLRSARLVLLPYQPQRYALRSSGVAWECFMHGLPVVAPAGTWIADQIVSGRACGVLFQHWELADIRHATEQALTGLDQLGRDAAALAPAWAAQGGARPMLLRIAQQLGLQ